MNTINSIAVYCGSSKGINPNFTSHAKALGKLMAQQDISLVFGAGKVGLMGVIADEVLSHNGKAIGVIPEILFEREVCHTTLTECYVTKNMHERKALISDRSDAYVAMPGGIGTLEEITEIITWFQIGVHSKPMGFLNVDGYYDKLFDFFNHMIDSQLLKPNFWDMICYDRDPAILIQKLKSIDMKASSKWIK